MPARAADRHGTAAAISFPPELPVSQRKDEIAGLIAGHQVVIVAGETGSGKTTQLPKICLALGRGVAGQIGHTQPRRIAARAVAARLASELGTEPATTVGFKIRFTDTSSDATRVKVMTDGILLAELARDRQLRRYDTLIIDEAHERSLNIDFILGYLKRLLPSRPDLKVIITSATIDPERFSKHFAGGESIKQSAGAGSIKQSGGAGSGEQGRDAPVIEVSGRTYPVEVRYRPLASPDDPGTPGTEPRDQVQGIIDGVAELRAEGPGDILVFLSGEREIRDTADALAGEDGLDVLPLYARLSAAEQRRVFEPHRGRRVVLATNVAETSLTVPGIRYVIDAGTARISRYSNRTKVQRLPIEPVSQASANQRAGRCGRTSDGVCLRLYSEEDFASRPEFTDPEILRTSLASVLLQMAALGLGDVAAFPFLDPPDSRQVADGVRLLEELGAFEPGKGGQRLTSSGRKLAQLPVDPRIGRMILAAGDNGCAQEVLIIAAALSIVDPRERPADSREAADAMHARFAEPGSDFLAYLRLWDYLAERQRELSGSAFRRMCRREHLHYLRVREWQDLTAQLRQAAAQARVLPRRAATRRPAVTGLVPDGQSAADRDAGPEARIPAELADRVHMSLLAGLLSQIGMRDERRPPPRQSRPGQPPGRRRGPAEFAGARGARFAIFPDSVLARKPPPWVVAAELVETSRLWARTAARIDPGWAEALAGHLVRRSYSEPRWDAGRGAAVATEKVLLYGLPVVAGRQVSYGRIDPAAARELFIQHALVEGDWEARHGFLAENRRLLDEAADLERKARRRGIVADDAAVFAFYDRRIPASVISARHFDSWWKQARRADPGLLTFSPEDLAGPAAAGVRPADYPGSLNGFGLSYQFAPGEPEDGVTADIPLARLNQVSGEEFGWQVPGLREELVTELIRSLPKQLRTAFVPAGDTARAVLGRLGEPRGDLLAALSAELGRMSGVRVPREAWNPSRLPAHLRVRFRVVDGGETVAAGPDLAALRQQLRPRLRATLASAVGGLTRSGLRDWDDLGTLPRVFADGQVKAYPALADAGDAVDVRLFDTPDEADEAMRRGTRRLILLQVPSGARAVASRLPATAKLAMSRAPYPGAGSLLADCAAGAADQVIADAGGPAWDTAGFARLLSAARTALPPATASVVGAAAQVLTAAQQAETRLAEATSPVLAPAVADLRGQLSGLVYPGFIAETGARRLPGLVRYLRAMGLRLDRAAENPGRDAELMTVVRQVTGAYQQALAELPASARSGSGAREVRWLIEELRVSLFAQSLGTAVPVSEKRIMKELARLAGS